MPTGARASLDASAARPRVLASFKNSTPICVVGPPHHPAAAARRAVIAQRQDELVRERCPDRSTDSCAPSCDASHNAQRERPEPSSELDHGRIADRSAGGSCAFRRAAWQYSFGAANIRVRSTDHSCEFLSNREAIGRPRRYCSANHWDIGGIRDACGSVAWNVIRSRAQARRRSLRPPAWPRAGPSATAASSCRQLARARWRPTSAARTPAPSSIDHIHFTCCSRRRCGKLAGLGHALAVRAAPAPTARRCRRRSAPNRSAPAASSSASAG